MMSNRLKIETQHIPYKGGSLAQASVVSGETEFLFDTWAGLPLIKSGKIMPLAVTSAERTSQLPDVPTMVESGLQNFTVDFWLGLLAPAGTPAAIIQRLHAVSKSVMEDAKVRASLSSQGDIVLEEPATFDRRIERESS